MRKRIILLALIFVVSVLIAVVVATPITPAYLTTRLGAFTGPENGADQDDNVKASLDLAHTDLDSGLANQEDALSIIGKGPGGVFYVDSDTDGTAGTSWATAVGTLDEAFALCTNDADDIVYVAGGHAETLDAADGFDADKSGVKIIGMGVGENRPTFTYDTSTDEGVIGADDVSIENCIFLAHVTSVAHAIDVETGAENFVIKNCDFVVDTEATDEFLDTITIAANCDNGLIENCRFYMGGGGAQSAINYAGADYLRIVDNEIYGDYAVGCIESATTVSVMVTIKDNVLYNGDISIGLNTEPCMELKSDDTGVIWNNMCVCDVAIAELAIVAADMHLSGNTYTETEGVYGAREIGLVPGRTYAVQTTTSTAYAEDLFTVAGGEILITSFVGRVVTAIAAAGGNLHVWCDATTAAQDIQFSTAVAVEGDAEGTLWCFDLDDGQAVLNPEENGGGSTYGNWYCPIGTIEQSNTDADATGVIVWTMTFIPLVDGVTVTPQ